METESNETTLYEGADRDGDQIQIVGLKTGEVILRVRSIEDGTTVGVYLDTNMMIDLVSSLLATTFTVEIVTKLKKGLPQ
jgi:hypothetical protein